MHPISIFFYLNGNWDETFQVEVKIVHGTWFGLLGLGLLQYSETAAAIVVTSIPFRLSQTEPKLSMESLAFK